MENTHTHKQKEKRKKKKKKIYNDHNKVKPKIITLSGREEKNDTLTLNYHLSRVIRNSEKKYIYDSACGAK